MTSLNNFNILVLGGSGAGKTVFLASMYDQLSVQQERIGFFVQAEGSDRADLVKSFQQIDTGREWPRGNRAADIRNWHFTCSINAGTEVFDVMSFDYLDYPGGILMGSSADNIDGFSIDAEADKADAILVLLDGHKILNHIRGCDDGVMMSFHEEISFVLPILQRKANKPVHFLVTKWDLFESAGIKFREVRNAIMSVEKLNTILNSRANREDGAQMRIIPVSAVGNGFAELQEDGEMRKTGQHAKPFNVELPMVCTLLDGFDVAHKALMERAQKEASGFSIFGRFTKKSAVNVAIKMLNVAQFVVPPQYRFSVPIMRGLFEYVDRKIKTGTGILKDELEEMQRNIQDQETAMKSAIGSYMYLVDRLDDDFPESKLTRL